MRRSIEEKEKNEEVMTGMAKAFTVAVGTLSKEEQEEEEEEDRGDDDHHNSHRSTLSTTITGVETKKPEQEVQVAVYRIEVNVLKEEKRTMLEEKQLVQAAIQGLKQERRDIQEEMERARLLSSSVAHAEISQLEGEIEQRREELVELQKKIQQEKKMKKDADDEANVQVVQPAIPLSLNDASTNTVEEKGEEKGEEAAVVTATTVTANTITTAATAKATALQGQVTDMKRTLSMLRQQVRSMNDGSSNIMQMAIQQLQASRQPLESLAPPAPPALPAPPAVETHFSCA